MRQRRADSSFVPWGVCFLLSRFLATAVPPGACVGSMRGGTVGKASDGQASQYMTVLVVESLENKLIADARHGEKVDRATRVRLYLLA